MGVGDFFVEYFKYFKCKKYVYVIMLILSSGWFVMLYGKCIFYGFMLNCCYIFVNCIFMISFLIVLICMLKIVGLKRIDM